MLAEFRSRYAHNFKSKTLTRPLRMLWEPLVFFTDLFLLYQYTVYFLYFEAYPFIFKGTYSLSPGLAAVAQLPSQSTYPIINLTATNVPHSWIGWLYSHVNFLLVGSLFRAKRQGWEGLGSATRVSSTTSCMCWWTVLCNFSVLASKLNS